MTIARRGLAALAVTLALSTSAFAQAWPNRPIRWIVPYTPGGYTDLMSRLVGQKVADALGVTVVFENKPGANAIIGTDAIVKAAPDGYTFGTVIAAHSVNPTLNSKIPYDTMKDITYVSLMSSAPLIIIANKSLPANSIQELVALAKSKPGVPEFRLLGRRRRRASHHGDVQGAHEYRHGACPLQRHGGRVARHGRGQHQRDVRHRGTPYAAGDGGQREGARPCRQGADPGGTGRENHHRAGRARTSSPEHGPASLRRPARRRRSSIASPQRPRRRWPIRR